MAVWELKSCPCGNGDLFIQRETTDLLEDCLLFGYERNTQSGYLKHYWASQDK